MADTRMPGSTEESGGTDGGRPGQERQAEARALVIEVLEKGIDLKRAGLLAYLLADIAGLDGNCECVGRCDCRSKCACPSKPLEEPGEI